MQENIAYQIYEVGFTRAQKLEPQEQRLLGAVPDLLHKCHSYFCGTSNSWSWCISDTQVLILGCFSSSWVASSNFDMGASALSYYIFVLFACDTLEAWSFWKRKQRESVAGE